MAIGILGPGKDQYPARNVPTYLLSAETAHPSLCPSLPWSCSFISINWFAGCLYLWATGSWLWLLLEIFHTLLPFSIILPLVGLSSTLWTSQENRVNGSFCPMRNWGGKCLPLICMKARRGEPPPLHLPCPPANHLWTEGNSCSWACPWSCKTFLQGRATGSSKVLKSNPAPPTPAAPLSQHFCCQFFYKDGFWKGSLCCSWAVCFIRWSQI